jgi:uncharacterized protein YkwD
MICEDLRPNAKMKRRNHRLPVALALTLGLALLLLWALAGSSTPVADAASYREGQGNSRADTPSVFLPLVSSSDGTLVVYPQDRQASRSFFHNVYLASKGVAAEWTGNQAACDEGTTAPAFRSAVLRRINYFRAMAGVPAGVTLSDELNAKAQKAALMMSANRQLDHSPPATWKCYSAGGADAAGSSNLGLGAYGPDVIDLYVQDSGGGNYAAGHRRWILYPQTETMGSGDIPSGSGYPAANALWVFDDNLFGPRPDTREEFVAWPPPGYVPYQVVFARWSFAFDGADFSSASVSITSDGKSVALALQPVVNGYGDNTLVWEPDATFSAPPISDIVYTVAINQMIIGGVFRNFTYDVIIFNPGSADATSADAVTDTQLGTPPKFP